MTEEHIERGVNDLKTIKRWLRALHGDLHYYEEHPAPANLRGLGNVAGKVAELIESRR